MVRPITLIAVVGGLLGSVCMAMVYDYLHDTALLPTDYLLGKYVGDDPADFQVLGVVSYVLIGTAFGGLFPWVAYRAFGSSNAFIAELPYTFVSALLFSLVPMAITALLVVTKVIEPPRNVELNLGTQLAPFLAYAFVLGLITGLHSVVWKPVLGL